MKTFKRIISIVIATVITFSSMWIYAVSVKADTFLLGDTDCDGDICITDATLVQRDIAQIISLTGASRVTGDIDADNNLTVYDVSCIQRWLGGMSVSYKIGNECKQVSPSESQKATVSADGKTATVGDVSFNISKLPDTLSITDSNKDKSINMMIIPKSEVDYHDMTTVVNNGVYSFAMDYTDRRIKEPYLIEKDNGILHGYDCTVRDHQGNELACVYAHYKSGLYYPYQTTVYCLEGAKESFPIDFYYKGVLLKRVTVSINTTSGPANIEADREFVRNVESKCWNSSMSDKEKMKAFGNYIADNYPYTRVMCVTGAVYTAYAARDLGLSSMLLYPGGEPNQNCGRHIITYNIHASTAVPGGHCACLIEYEDGLVRYDVQGGLCWIRDYQFPY